MNRILVIGCCGAGKSTLSRTLGETLGLPVHHLDRLFWRPGWKERDQDEFRHDQEAILRESRWIIDGNYGSSLAPRLAACDTVIYLDLPTWICFVRILKRRFTRGDRPDMTDGCPERINWEFYRYVLSFRRRERPHTESLLADATHCRIHRLRTQGQVRTFLSDLSHSTDYCPLPPPPDS